jgi:hypothetical protein
MTPEQLAKAIREAGLTMLPDFGEVVVKLEGGKVVNVKRTESFKGK